MRRGAIDPGLELRAPLRTAPLHARRPAAHADTQVARGLELAEAVFPSNLRGSVAARPSILLVVNERPVLDSLSILFTRLGYRVTTAQSGQAGIEQLRKERPDVVVCDLEMPDVTGLDVLRAAHDIERFLPVILITSRADVDTAIEALKEGALQYIQYIETPFENRELAAKVEAAVQLSGTVPMHGNAELAPPHVPSMETIEKAYIKHVMEMTEANERESWLRKLGRWLT